jgi:Family of unknown function (DUF5681)
LARALGERVEAEVNGRRLRMTNLEAAVKQLVNNAAKGGQRAAQLVFALYRDDSGHFALNAAERGARAG